jgi:hypothetical protein
LEPTPETADDAAETSSSKSRDYSKTAGLLTIGVGLTGLFSFVYFFIAAHGLSTGGGHGPAGGTPGATDPPLPSRRKL